MNMIASRPPAMRSVTWPGLDLTETPPVRNWDGARRWGQNRKAKGGGAIVYRRCAGFPVEIDSATHEFFLGLLKRTTDVWAWVFETVGAEVPKFGHVTPDKQKPAGPTRYWSKVLESGIYKSQKAALVGSGFLDGCPEYIAGMAAAGRAVVGAKPDAVYGMAPTPWWKGDHPSGMTVRLNIGHANTRPIFQDQHGFYLEGGALLRPQGPYPKNCGDAAYAEIAHIRGAWRARLVFVDCEPRMA